MALLDYEGRVSKQVIAEWEPVSGTNQAYVFEYHPNGVRVTEVNRKNGEEIACEIDHHWVRINFPWPEYFKKFERSFSLFLLERNKKKLDRRVQIA